MRGEKPPRSLTKRTLDQREISRIPGTNGDALRSLLNLPGVGRPPGLAGLLIVRGSAPQDSQYFIDGTPVPIVYHFGGLSSVVPTEMIERLDFYPGNFSAQFGRAMGGIVDVGLLEPAQRSPARHGGGQSARHALLAQGPIFETGWRFAIAGRRSNLDEWLGPVLKAAQSSVSVSPVYYDYQAILERDLGKRSTLRFALFGSDDALAILNTNASSSEPELAGSLSTHTGFWRAQASFKSHLGENTDFRIVGAIGRDYRLVQRGQPQLQPRRLSDHRARRAVAEARSAADDERRPRLARGAVHRLGALAALPEARAAADGAILRSGAAVDAGVRERQSARDVRRVGGDALARLAHRPRDPARLHPGHRVVGPRPAHQPASRRHDVAADDDQGGRRAVLAASASAGDERRLRDAGAHRPEGDSLRSRRGARAVAQHRCVARGLLQAARLPPHAGRRERGQRRHLRGRDADPLQAGRALLRLARVHALAKLAARTLRGCRSSSPSSTRPTS